MVLLIGGTFAWQVADQQAINNAHGAGMGSSVTLTKLEKDMTGAPTTRVIPGAEFYLYKVGDVALG
jgi:hypothetical protein